MVGAQDRAFGEGETHAAGIYISIVAAGRNDNYGGSKFADRVQLFANTLVPFACQALYTYTHTDTDIHIHIHIHMYIVCVCVCVCVYA